MYATTVQRFTCHVAQGLCSAQQLSDATGRIMLSVRAPLQPAQPPAPQLLPVPPQPKPLKLAQQPVLVQPLTTVIHVRHISIRSVKTSIVFLHLLLRTQITIIARREMSSGL